MRVFGKPIMILWPADTPIEQPNLTLSPSTSTKAAIGSGLEALEHAPYGLTGKEGVRSRLKSSEMQA